MHLCSYSFKCVDCSNVIAPLDRWGRLLIRHAHTMYERAMLLIRHVVCNHVCAIT